MSEPIEYTPKQQEQKPQPSSYVLVNDVTGKPPPLRGPQTLKAYTEIKDEATGKMKQLVVPFKVPYPPKANCKKCYGRGYIGIQSVGDQKGILYCKKCFPML
jgi:hypothetical protein